MKKIFFSCLIILSLHAMDQEKNSTSGERILDALNIEVAHYNPTLSVMTYNVDNAVLEEKFENTKWTNRASRVIKLINDSQADLVCLQELRQLPDNRSVNNFLGDFDKYRFVMGYRGPSKLSFAQAILYDPERLFAVESCSYWLSDTPDEVSDTWTAKKDAAWGNTLLCAKFLLVHQGRIVKDALPLWVYNTHFGFDEEIKTKSCHKVLEIMNRRPKGHPAILCGDLNLFPDKNANTQRKILTEQLQDLGKDAQTLSGKKVEGTFVGFEHDKFKADLNNMNSRLDHILGSPTIAKVGPAILYTKTMLDIEPEELTNRNYPSDHLPLMVKLKLYGNAQ